LFDFKIAETKSFEKTKQQIDAKLYGKIRNVVYPQLKSNPFFGANIKKLKGEFDGVYRCRVGSYRLFYTVENDRVIVFVIDPKKRKDAYSK
jgi:mRNA interferase RelE/StbE